MTADDRHGVQCRVCHRLVDPFAAAENPPEDAAILAALTAPVPTLGSAMMVIDPLDRLRGPFDVIADLGFDPHQPTAETLVSPFHRSADMCGTCHNVRNPAFTRNMLRRVRAQRPRHAGRSDARLPRAVDLRRVGGERVRGDRRLGAAVRPQPRPSSRPARTATCRPSTATTPTAGTVRDDVPLHDFVGGNTFIPDVLPHHPAFGGEVDAALLQETVAKATEACSARPRRSR